MTKSSKKPDYSQPGSVSQQFQPMSKEDREALDESLKANPSSLTIRPRGKPRQRPKKEQEGKEIYERKKQYFSEKGRNTQEWNEKIRGNHLKKIVSHFGGEKIPYSCFSESKQLCRQIFDRKNDWNYIYYTIFMGLELGRLKEEPDGLLYTGDL